MSKKNDSLSDWNLRLGEVVISDYIVVFGYVNTYNGIYVRLYQAVDQKQIFGRLLHDLQSSQSEDGIRVNFHTCLPSNLFNEIHMAAKRLEKLKVFA